LTKSQDPYMGIKLIKRAFQTHYMRGTMSKNGQDRSSFTNTSLIVILQVSHPNVAYGHMLTHCNLLVM
jgi:hypothetical protein